MAEKQMAGIHPAIQNLMDHQRQLDMDGCEVGVSRQALDEAFGLVGEMLGELKMCEQFILNGVELGYIKLPSASGDPASDRLPSLHSVIALASGDAPCVVVEVLEQDWSPIGRRPRFTCSKCGHQFTSGESGEPYASAVPMKAQKATP